MRTGLLERERELGLLVDAFTRAAQGEAGVLLIEGDAGLGKSSVLDDAARIGAGHGFTVLRARGGMLERTLGWGVARQLFEATVQRAPAAIRRALLRGSAALAAPVLGLVDPGEEDSNAVRDFHLEHGLYWLVCNLTERGPLALLVDDAQWCDDAALEWLLYLARRAEQLPLVLVLAARPGEPGAPRVLLDLIAAEPLTTAATLPPLSLAATESLLEQAYGTPVDSEFASACHQRTGGNPLFVKELAGELAAEGIDPVASAASRIETVTPEGVSRVILLRLGRLSEAALRLARAVAVLESAAQVRLAFELAGLDNEAEAGALDELIAARIVRLHRSLQFVHPLIGAVVYNDLAPPRRSTMHKQAARLLAAAGTDPGLVAAQLLRSVPDGEAWVVRELGSAADRDIARGSPSTAVALLRRALDEPPDADALARTLLALGTAEALIGEPTAIETLRRGLSATADPRYRAEIALLLGRMLVSAGDARAAVDVLTEVGDRLGWADAGLRLKLEAALVNAARTDIDTLGLIPDRLRLALEHIDEDTHGGRLIAAQLSWGLTAIAAPATQSIELARRGLAGGRLIDDALAAPEAYLGATHMLAFADELEEADGLFGRAIELARRSGSVANFAAGSCFRAYTKYLRGELAAAELCARDALRTGTDSRAMALVRALATAYLALVLIDRGEPRVAAAVLAAGPHADEAARETWATELMFATARVALAEDRPADALELLLGCGRRSARWTVVNPAWLPWRSEAGLVLHQLGQDREAERLCDEELSLARRVGAARSLGIALRAAGLVQGGTAGLALLRESAATLSHSPARLEHARSLLELGRALRRANCRAEARGPLAEGLSLAEHSGAVTLEAQARSELAAIGARPRSVVRTGADSLTASERRVCELAASGKSNPEIAQLLFVTRATVESHLHSAYRRLGIASRKGLAEALAATPELQ